MKIQVNKRNDEQIVASLIKKINIKNLRSKMIISEDNWVLEFNLHKYGGFKLTYNHNSGFISSGFYTYNAITNTPIDELLHAFKERHKLHYILD